MNSVAFTGNLTRDPSVVEVSESSSVTKFSVAINGGYMKDGQFVSEPTYVDVSAWGGVGEKVANKAAKGDAVGVTGRLKQERWTDAEGNQRSKITVVASHVDILNSRSGKASAKAEDESGEAQSEGAPFETNDEEIPF